MKILWASRSSLVILLLASALFAAKRPSGNWIGTWAASPQAEQITVSPLTGAGATYREIVHISSGGVAVRIVVTNEFGREPLTIGAAQIAISAGGNTIDSSTAKPLKFGDQSSVTVPPGALMVSDPVDMKLPPLANVAVSLYFPAQPMSQASVHPYALQSNYRSAGNQVSSTILHSVVETPSWYFLKGVEVQADEAARAGAIVALGDSITDGAASIQNTNGRWPDILASRIQANDSLSGIAVLNAGINGNRLLRDEDGDESALRRLDRDVLAQPGVQYLIVLEGINDIGHNVSATSIDPAITAKDLTGALQQIAIRVHAHGIKVIGATILPYEDCKYASPEGEKIREAVNDWIRTTPSLDGFVDFEKVVRDPRHPTRFSTVFDSGDHLHPNADGLKAMADSIDLTLFAP